MARISSSRETVSRVMRRLQQAGLVKSNGQQVILLDVDGLLGITLEEAEQAE